MAQTISPKADQPKVTTESLKRGSQPAALEYRVQRSSTNNRGPATKDYGTELAAVGVIADQVTSALSADWNVVTKALTGSYNSLEEFQDAQLEANKLGAQ